MRYSFYYWLFRVWFFIRKPYVPGKLWRPIYRVYFYLRYKVLQIDFCIALEYARGVALRFARATLLGT